MGGSRCCVGGCTNERGTQISLHSFPKKQSLRRKWVKAIQFTGGPNSRSGDWKGPSKDLSYNSQLVYSRHFEDECFTLTTRTTWRLNLTPRPILEESAIPTPFGGNVRTSRTAAIETSTSVTRKREPNRIVEQYDQQLNEIVEEAKVTRDPSTVLVDGDDDHGDDGNGDESLNETINYSDYTSSANTVIESKNTTECSDRGHKTAACQISVDDSHMLKTCTCLKCTVKTHAKGFQVNIKPTRLKHKETETPAETQTQPEVTSTIGTQYEIGDCEDHIINIPMTSTPHKISPLYNQQRDVSFLYSTSVGLEDDQEDDPDFEPDESYATDTDNEEIESVDPREQRKFVVFEENLLSLFRRCNKCNSPVEPEICQQQGSYIAIRQGCDCGHTRRWESQPKVNNIPAGNLLLSASILFAGCSPSKVLRVFYFFKLMAISLNTFFDHQKKFLWPAVEKVWHSKVASSLETIRKRGRDVILAGDGRADSPGHTAKYGAYSFIDMESGHVIGLLLVQSNEVKSSYHMELEGLQRGLAALHQEGIGISDIVTDRHVQIAKWLGENLPKTRHSFDVWHVAKAVKKKLLALSKENDCASVSKWIKSISNHIYWASAEESGEMIVSKWKSVAAHVQNIHCGHEGPLEACIHQEISGREWLKTGSKCAVKLEDIVFNKRLCSDMKKLSTCFQTSTLESFHSVINHFAPKMNQFSYHGQVCRQHIAALHFNENINR